MAIGYNHITPTQFCGMAKCKEIAREALFRLGMSTDVKNLAIVNDCPECASCQNKLKKETLRPSKITDRPWSEVGVGLFEFE